MAIIIKQEEIAGMFVSVHPYFAQFFTAIFLHFKLLKWYHIGLSLTYQTSKQK